MRKYNDKALDITEYAIGAPIFALVAALTAAVMAVGLGVIETVSWLRHRG